MIQSKGSVGDDGKLEGCGAGGMDHGDGGPPGGPPGPRLIIRRPLIIAGPLRPYARTATYLRALSIDRTCHHPSGTVPFTFASIT